MRAAWLGSDLRHRKSPSPLPHRLGKQICQSRLRVTHRLPCSPHHRHCPPVSGQARERGGESHSSSGKWQRPCRLIETCHMAQLCSFGGCGGRQGTQERPKLSMALWASAEESSPSWRRSVHRCECLCQKWLHRKTRTVFCHVPENLWPNQAENRNQPSLEGAESQASGNLVHWPASSHVSSFQTAVTLTVTVFPSPGTHIS